MINSNDFPDCHYEGYSVLYVDDDTDSVHSDDPVQVKNLIQKEMNNSVSWQKQASYYWHTAVEVI